MASPVHQPLRFLLVTPDFPPSLGGIQTYLHTLCAGAKRLAPTVVAPAEQGCEAFDAAQPFPIYRVGVARLPIGRLPKRALVLPLALKALRVARSRRYSVAVAGHVLAAPAALAVARLRRIPYVLFTYALELRAKRAQPIVRWAVRTADRILTISTFTRNECIRLGAGETKIFQTALGVTPNGAAVLNEAARSRVAAKWGRLASGSLILSVARLNERYKGHDMLLHALPLVAAQVPDVLCVIAGDGWLKPYYASLAHSLGVADKVLFVGSVSDEDLQSLYAACDVFALCSRERLVDGGAEGFGLVFLEANVHGKPVVGGRSGGIPDAVVDGVTGLLVNPTSELEIADALIRLLRDRALAQRLGEQGRERALNELTWDKVIARIEGMLVEVAESRRGGRP